MKNLSSHEIAHLPWYVLGRLLNIETLLNGSLGAPVYKDMVRWMALVAMCVAVGCSAQSSDPLVFEWQGSDAGRAMAEDAAAEWRAVCHVGISIAAHGAPLREVDGFPDIMPDGLPSVGLVGYTFPDGSIDVHRRGAFERTTIAHEMGHALGLRHSTAGVMAPRATGLERITPADCP